MTQNLIVCGKEYFPSTELAHSFGYTPDYVSRLAREGKITAANINRKWFVEKKSLEEFVFQANLGKEVRSDVIKKQRKVERLLHSQSLKRKKSLESSLTHVALAQSLAVFMCVAFMGLLGWTVSSNDIKPIDLANGVKDSYGQIVATVILNSSSLEMFSRSSVATVFITDITDGSSAPLGTNDSITP